MLLHLHLKRVYWLQVIRGEKPAEFREQSAYWRKRLFDGDGRPREYDGLMLYDGFVGGPDHRLQLPWRGFRLDSICHEHFGPGVAHVYAIRLDLSSVPAAALQRLRNAQAA